MSTTVNVYQKTGERVIMPLDDKRGTYGVLLLIATETALFVTLFCAYFLIGNNKDRWRINQPPHLTYAFIMLGVMIVSSLVLIWGERLVSLRRYASARIAMGITFLLGLVFLALQSVAYVEHWKRLAPYSNSYGSAFYAITFMHDAHVIVGMLILLCAMCLPHYQPTTQTPYRVYHVAALYWYWVTIMLIFVVVILYVIPNGIVYGL